MGILLNGWSISRSRSPVIIHEAPAVTANSRNLLSFGSRQAVICSLGSMAREFEIIFSIKANLISKETYFSNFDRENTLKYSDAISVDTSNEPLLTAFFKDTPGTESSFNKALSNVLVSKTQKLG